MDFNLQLFADDSAVINKTTSEATGNNLSAENKTFYDKQLIRLAGSKLVFSKFGQKRDIPQNGGKTSSSGSSRPSPRQGRPLPRA